MITNQIQHALSQVRDLQQKVLEGQRFRGYSGRARAISGTLALLTAVILAALFPESTAAHAIGWGTVFVIACLINYGALLYWFLFDPVAKRDVRRLGPTTDALPPFFVGGVLTFVFIMNGLHGLLFGTWMALFGLANLASRRALPRNSRWLGWFYILCGALCLGSPHVSFTNPWPMGVVFFVGEWVGGILLHFHSRSSQNEPASVSSFLNLRGGKSNARVTR